MNRVAILLVSYNGKEYTKDCIDSIINSDYGDYSIILIDNASSDGTVDYVKENYEDRVVILQEAENLGFARANNIGAEYAIKHGAEYVLLLNNDTVIDRGMISSLLKVSNEYTISVPKMFYFDKPDAIWYAGGKINKFKGYTEHIGTGVVDQGQYDEQKQIDFATGCCMLIHKNTIQKIGLFDENYFMYFEDSDFCLKAKKFGVKIIYTPLAQLWHKVSSSSGNGISKFQIYYTTRNRLYFVNKYKNQFYAVGKLYVWLFAFLRGLKGFVLGSNAKFAWIAAYDYRKKMLGKSNRKLI